MDSWIVGYHALQDVSHATQFYDAGSLATHSYLYLSRPLATHSIYPVQRAAGLQRYCNELLCNPAALGCSGVAGFFELDTVCG